ncbi:MAG: creatininase family protein [Chloroflexota bacterium]
MTVLLGELTRDKIAAIAPDSIAVLPTAAVEQHGPHMPIITDTLLCGTVAERAAEKANANVLVAPVFCYGNSHHHRPFEGTLSLTSQNYIASVIDVLEGLVLSGFKKLVILNGHGGNMESNDLIGLDFTHRLGHPVTIATGSYWDIARPALVEKGIIPSERIPGHAGRFETSMMLALRPDLVDTEAMVETQAVEADVLSAVNVGAGVKVKIHGAWAAGTGYSDDPRVASADEGAAILDAVVDEVSRFYEQLGNFSK